MFIYRNELKTKVTTEIPRDKTSCYINKTSFYKRPGNSSSGLIAKLA